MAAKMVRRWKARATTWSRTTSPAPSATKNPDEQRGAADTTSCRNRPVHAMDRGLENRRREVERDHAEPANAVMIIASTVPASAAGRASGAPRVPRVDRGEQRWGWLDARQRAARDAIPASQ